ncbi:MAG: restriction endonuclease subunit S [Deltaproteobacteria bacterium]|nr:restriction endonuclease subunit S [Deltaproteobacteria bacterium]
MARSQSACRKLGDYFKLSRGTTYKSQLLGLPGPVLLGLASIARNGGFRRDSLRTYGGESPAKLLVHPGQLYLSLKDVTQAADLLGAVARLPRDHLPGRLTQDTVRLDPIRDDVPMDYLYWVLRTPQYRQYCRSHSTGTTNLGLPREDWLAFGVPDPTPARWLVVNALNALDDKIEVNRRTSETLETMARALFKSWFVDFDPVRVKAEGRKPTGMDAETAKLFPAEFVKSDLGPIPKGWTCDSLGSWVTALSGGTPSKADGLLWGGELPWISPKVMTALHADEAEAFVTARAIDKGTRLAPVGSTLVMVRGMGLHQEVRVSQTRREVTFNQDVKALVPKGIEPSLLLFALLDAQDELLTKVESSGHGTGKLPTEILLGHRLVMPPAEVQMRLGAYFDAINDRIASAREENRTLTAVRDLLLPRLLSGEVKVRGAEPLAEAVA